MYVYRQALLTCLFPAPSTGELADHATHFRHSSRRLQRKAWWQQCRLKLILAAVIAIILVIVISESLYTFHDGFNHFLSPFFFSSSLQSSLLFELVTKAGLSNYIDNIYVCIFMYIYSLAP